MALRLSLSLLVVFSVPIKASSSGWVSLPLTYHDKVRFFGEPLYRTKNLLVGTPPANISPVLNIGSSLMGINSNKCVFCPGSNLFDTSLSSTYQTNNQPCTNSVVGLEGVVANDTFSLGGVLTSQNNLFELFDQMSLSYVPRFTDGHFGLWVDPTNEKDHILTRLHDSGQLLNPVVGLRIGSTPETSHITIGALDPSDFDGTINWIEAETSDSSWLSAAGIKIDGFRGFNNSFLPSTTEGPIISYLNSLTIYVALPDAPTYMSQVGYRGPVDVGSDPINGYQYRCSDTNGTYVHLSVDINGVNYQVDSPGNLWESGLSVNQCDVWITGNTVGVGNVSVESTLGLPFLRSVYLAYRFPTPECPKAFYGFAFQKGANRTSSMLAQQPRSTPTQSSQCLSLTAPTSTPSVSAPPPLSTDKGLSDGTYSVWGRPGQEQVRLKDIEHLPAGLVED